MKVFILLGFLTTQIGISTHIDPTVDVFQNAEDCIKLKREFIESSRKTGKYKKVQAECISREVE